MGLKNPIHEIKKWFKRIEKLGKSAERNIKHLGGDIKDDIEGAAHSAKKGIESAGSTAEHSIEKFAKSAERNIERTAEKAIDSVEDAFEDALQALLAEVSKGAFNKAVDVAQTVAPDDFGLSIGPITLEISDIKSRIDTLQRWAKHPPDSSDKIKECIRTLAPSRVSVAVDIQFALLFVSSDALQVGFSAGWNTESFLEKFDDIIKHF